MLQVHLGEKFLGQREQLVQRKKSMYKINSDSRAVQNCVGLQCTHCEHIEMVTDELKVKKLGLWSVNHNKMIQ